jgi:hypothetical protein
MLEVEQMDGWMDGWMDGFVVVQSTRGPKLNVCIGTRTLVIVPCSDYVIDIHVHVEVTCLPSTRLGFPLNTH